MHYHNTSMKMQRMAWAWCGPFAGPPVQCRPLTKGGVYWWCCPRPSTCLLLRPAPLALSTLRRQALASLACAASSKCFLRRWEKHSRKIVSLRPMHSVWHLWNDEQQFLKLLLITLFLFTVPSCTCITNICTSSS